jgi:hypothetical protein
MVISSHPVLTINQGTAVKTRSVSLEVLSDIVAEMVITVTRDLGAMLLHEGTHPTLGHVVTVQDAASSEAILIRP